MGPGPVPLFGSYGDGKVNESWSKMEMGVTDPSAIDQFAIVVPAGRRVICPSAR